MAFLAFDVYGTLVDPLGIEQALRLVVGDSASQFAATWRQLQIDAAFRRSLMKRYANFDVVTRDALRATAHQLGVTLSPATETSLLAAYLQLPPFPESRAGLVALAAEGHSVSAFSNGLEVSLRALLTHARLLPPLESIISVDDVKTFKPDPAVYLELVRRAGAPADRTWLVSSNAWDVLGAKSAGLRAVWVRRLAQVAWDGWGIAEPDLIVGSLAELSGRIPRTV